jgi:hypothetical protein
MLESKTVLTEVSRRKLMQARYQKWLIGEALNKKIRDAEHHNNF